MLSKKTIGCIVGCTILFSAIGLIVYGQLAGSVTPIVGTWSVPPKIVVCDTAPAWALPTETALKDAVLFLDKHGWAAESVESGICDSICSSEDEDGTPVSGVPCLQGAVIIDTFSVSLKNQAKRPDVCLSSRNESTNAFEWATVMVQPVIYGDDGSEEILPADINTLVLTHSLMHCLAGFGHNQGPEVIPGFLRLPPKTGHLMNPELYKIGWNDEGLKK